MNLLYSAIVLDPGGLIAWLVVGVVAGWLAGKVMKGALLPTERVTLGHVGVRNLYKRIL